MCLLIHKPVGGPIIQDGWFDNFWSRNPDGFGAFWIDGNQIQVLRSIDKEEARTMLREVERLGVECGLHWRMATHGAEDLTNCHPFVLTGTNNKPTTVVAHNGVLSDWASNGRDQQASPSVYERKKTGASDTANFVRRAMRPIVHGYGLRSLFEAGSDCRKVIQELIGSPDKLLIANVKLGFTRLSRPEWTEWRGMQMSNTYAWDYFRRDEEDGPQVKSPFEYTERLNPKEGWVWESGCYRRRSWAVSPDASKENGKNGQDAGVSVSDIPSRDDVPAYLGWLRAWRAHQGLKGEVRYDEGSKKYIVTVPLGGPGSSTIEYESTLGDSAKRTETKLLPSPFNPAYIARKVEESAWEVMIDTLASMVYADVNTWVLQEPEQAAGLLNYMLDEANPADNAEGRLLAQFAQMRSAESAAWIALRAPQIASLLQSLCWASQKTED